VIIDFTQFHFHLLQTYCRHSLLCCSQPSKPPTCPPQNCCSRRGGDLMMSWLLMAKQQSTNAHQQTSNNGGMQWRMLAADMMRLMRLCNNGVSVAEKQWQCWQQQQHKNNKLMHDSREQRQWTMAADMRLWASNNGTADKQHQSVAENNGSCGCQERWQQRIDYGPQHDRCGSTAVEKELAI